MILLVVPVVEVLQFAIVEHVGVLLALHEVPRLEMLIVDNSIILFDSGRLIGGFSDELLSLGVRRNGIS